MLLLVCVSTSGSGPGAGHVPYRASKLTLLLRNALGGNSKCCVVINVSPQEGDATETLASLRFGDR